MAKSLPKTTHTTSTYLNQSWILAGSKAQLESFMAKEGLNKVEGTPCFKITARGTDASQSGQRKLYEDRWKDMRKFFCMIGDYQSALIVSRDMCPDFPLPIKPASLCAYGSLYCNDVGTIVMHYATDTPILDRHGKHIIALRLWHSPNNVNKLQAGVKALHQLYEHLRPVYSLPCSECILLTRQFKSSSQAYTPCRHHTGGAHIAEKGNPMLDKDVRDHFSKLRADLSRTFQEKGNVQLTPFEIRQLRKILLVDMGNPNPLVALEGLKFYTMIILGIKLFLRASELLTIRMEDFVENLQLISSERGVRALVIRVCGKSDMRNVSLVLFSDEEFPEFCPVRHLLLWIHLSGVKSGYLFPDEWVTPRAHNDGCYRYKNFLAKLKFLCVEKLSRRSEINIYGTHVLRKTGYLFAIWGIMKISSAVLKSCHDIPKLYMGAVMQSARHKSVSNAVTYARDSFCLYEWTLHAAELTSEAFADSIPKWRDIAILEAEPFAASTGSSRALQGSLDEVSRWWFSTFCGLWHSEGDLLSRYITACFASRAVTSEHSCHVENLLKMHVPASNLASGLESFRIAMRNHAAAAILDTIPVNIGVHDGVPPANVAVSPSTTQAPKRKRLCGDNDLLDRHVLKNTTCEGGKKELLYRIYVENKAVSSDEMTSAARKVWYLAIKPIGKCMDICFFKGQPSTFPHKVRTGKTYKCASCGILKSL